MEFGIQSDAFLDYLSRKQTQVTGKRKCQNMHSGWSQLSLKE